MTADGAVLRDRTVLIRAGRITSIEAAARATVPASGLRRIDGTGKWLMPALSDMHVHFENDRMLRMWRGDDRATDGTVRTQDIAAPYVANGVLQVANLSAMSESIGQRIEIESGRVLGPHLALAAMIDGSPPDWPPGMTRVAANPADGRQAVRDALAEGYDFIKVYNKLDVGTFGAIVDEARQRKVQVAGHLIGRGAGITDQLFVPGFGLVAHLQEYAQQSNGELTDAQIQHLAQLTLRNGTWVVTTLSADQRLVRTVRDPKSLQDWPHAELVHPLMHDFWVNDNRMLRDRSPERVARFERIATDSARLLRAFFAAGVPLLAGTDTPMPRQTAGFALHDELEAMAAQGMPNAAVLQSATRLPAQWLGVIGDRGTVEQGKRADLLLLAADPLADVAHTRHIEAVILGGRYLPRAGPRCDAGEPGRALCGPAPGNPRSIDATHEKDSFAPGAAAFDIAPWSSTVTWRSPAAGTTAWPVPRPWRAPA